MCKAVDVASAALTARQLKELRINRGLSPEQLGHKVGISGRTIRRIEEGNRPTARVMFALAQEFECEVVDLWPV